MENQPKLASIEVIKNIIKHPNADTLAIASVLGFKIITRIAEGFKAGDLVVFIQPDTVLPDAPWTTFYKAKSNRVKAIQLRGEWSEGIIEKLEKVGLTGNLSEHSNGAPFAEGRDVTKELGILKYEAPIPQDHTAMGDRPDFIPKTDETRWENFEKLPFGKKVDVTLKIDGASATYYARLAEDGKTIERTGICGRELEYKAETINNYTINETRHSILGKLKEFCIEAGLSLALQGESYGNQIQNSSLNWHARHPLSIAFFKVWNIKERRYCHKGNPFYIHNPEFMKKLGRGGLPAVPILEQDVILTPELIKKYAEELREIDGHPFEGVVIQHSNGSFKVLNKYYDSKKN